MTDQITYPLDPAATGAADRVTFTLLESLQELPEAPGLFVLLGRDGEGALRPLCFGAADRLDRMPRSEVFALALHEGFHSLAIAPLPRDGDAAVLAETLGQVNGAPLNTRRAALRAIEAARMTGQTIADQALPVAAE